jgi:hypothetical protein
MELARSSLLVGLLALGSCQALHSDKADQSITVALGEGALGSGGWNQFDDSWLLSVDYAVEPHDALCGVEGGMQVGQADGPNAVQQRDVELSEMWIGATKSWKPSSWLRLQGGAGLRFAKARLLAPGFIFEDEIDSDTSLGLYAHVGAFAHVAGPFSIGVDARWADGSDYLLENQHRDALLTQLLFGLRWDF